MFPNKRHPSKQKCHFQLILLRSKMSENLKKYAPYLHLLHNCSPRARKSLVDKHCNKEFMNCICECAKNVLDGNVDLTDLHKRTLKRHRALLHKLVLKKTPMKNKKKILQTGGFLGALLGQIVKSTWQPVWHWK